jgi:LPPG:FO 2-phospho-L-lactate transferase
VKIDIVPMADSSVATTILTDDGPLAFQHYFVRDKCNPKVKGFKFEGLDKARPADGINRFNAERQRALLIAPSNPFVSIDPILGIPKLRETFIGSCQVKLAVSPIVGGIAIKGPAAKMMSELGIPSTATEVARHYLGLIDGIVIDEVDREQASQIESLGIKPFVTKTIMSTLDDKIGLATDCIEYIDYLAGK